MTRKRIVLTVLHRLAVLAYVAFTSPPLTREERATRARLAIGRRFSDKQQAFIDFVLSPEGQKMLREPRIGRLAISPSAYAPDETPPHLSETEGIFNRFSNIIAC